MNGFRNDMLNAAGLQLALDMACTPEDFLKSENTIVRSELLSGRREFSYDQNFFRAACFGNGTVFSVSPEIYTFTAAFSKQLSGVEVFDAKGIYFINKELEKYDKAVGAFSQYYLPDVKSVPNTDCGIKTVVFEEKDIPQLYRYKQFKNALCFKSEGQRRDVLAVCAVNGGDIAGMAGASSDSERFWQIGIDVMPQYRCRGIATHLVSRLTFEIMRRGAVPYYGTWWSNIPSRSVAKKSGYYPAWVEINAVNIHDRSDEPNQ